MTSFSGFDKNLDLDGRSIKQGKDRIKKKNRVKSKGRKRVFFRKRGRERPIIPHFLIDGVPGKRYKKFHSVESSFVSSQWPEMVGFEPSDGSYIIKKVKWAICICSVRD